MKTNILNKKNMSLIGVFVLFFLLTAFSQTPNFTDTIRINQNFSTSTEIYPFSQSTMYGLGIDGDINLRDDNSIVKIILRDSLSLDYLIYETNSYLSPVASFAFSNECEETSFMAGFIPTSIEIQILNADVHIKSVSYASMYVEDATDLQQQFRESKILEKIDLMNDFIQREGLIWAAGKTSSLSMYYNDKKELYKSSIWNPAFEYYIGGFFVLKSPDNGANITVNYDYVDNFDWRNRHGANDPSSSYYDGDPLGSGWITSPACQSGCWIDGVLDCSVHKWQCNGEGYVWNGAATCWAFGPTSHIEALVNLYLNQHYDVNLAEQEIVSCSYDQPHITAGSPDTAYTYFINSGVVNEDCFLYTAEADPCEDCCTSPLERIKINDFIKKQVGTVTQKELRETIMNHGPVSARAMNINGVQWGHSMQLVGWDIIKWGDEFSHGTVPTNPYFFQDYVGCTYWIYKENGGVREGFNGLIYVIHTNDDTPGLYIVPTNTTDFITSVVGNFDEDDIACVDNDLDGYFNWGIGPKPPTCPPGTPDEPDGDDNNPGLGPFNEHGFCKIINTYNSGFEKTMDNWKQRNDDDCDWMRYYGATPNYPVTGPSGTPDGSDYYIYMDGDGCMFNAGAYIESPPIDLSYACGIEMTFAYHKNTLEYEWEDDGKLSLDISYDDGQTWVNNYWYVKYDHGDQWHYVTVSLPAQVNKVRFYAYTGWINRHDIALDDITIGPASNSEIVIESDETWNKQNYFICNNIVIEPNATLTIEDGATVDMQVGTKIIIKPSGKLIVNNATITSSEYWQGIEVWGNSEENQWPDAQGIYAQGYLELIDAVIENAIDAVSLWQPGDYTTTGGIVIARNSDFTNNKRSVHALQYTNFHPEHGKEMDNRATFTRCNFQVDMNYHGIETFYKHVDLDQVRGVRFMSCSFYLNQAPNVSPDNMAIESNSAGFSVNSICSDNIIPCQSYLPSFFNGFKWAIKANNAASNRTFFVNRAYFSGNAYGIYANGINNFSVLNSKFNIYYNQTESEPCESVGRRASGFGIHMTGCTGFAIEENEFKKAPLAPEGDYTGIYIAETQAADQVYRNTFNDLNYGNYARGKNWYHEDTWKGLAYYCNIHTGNTQDIKVMKNIGFPPTGGVQNQIGSSTLPAGNTFSTNADYHIYNDGIHWIDYYYYTPDNPTEVYQVHRHEVGIQNQCPSNYGGGGSSTRDVVLSPEQKLEEEMEYAAGLSDYNNVKTLYENLKDGGSTTATLTDIASAWPSDMWALRAELLGKSPHLSMGVLKAAADKTDVLPENVIFEIMAANPDELKKEELIKYLEDKNNPLPEYMIEILNQVAMGTTYKTALQRQMAHYSQEKTRAAHNIIRSLLNDTISDIDELRNWLDNIGGKRADEQIIASYMSEGNFANALSLANMMPALYNYTGNDLAEHTYYTDMLNLHISLEQQQRTILDLDSMEIANLVFIAENSTGTAGTEAKGILEYAYGYNYCNCIDADESGLKSSGHFNAALLDKLSGIEITVRPNPAKEWAVFNYVLPNDNSHGVIKISDASGKEITSMPVSGKQGQQIWDTRMLKPGVYNYTLDAAGFSRHGKIVINR